MNQLTRHDDFIEKPMQSVLEEGLQAIGNIENSMEVYPLYEYLLQSIFLKMTGFQEQKLKLIHWTIATYDDDARWEYQQQHAKNGYSAYNEVNIIFGILFENVVVKNGLKTYQLLCQTSNGYLEFDDGWAKEFLSINEFNTDIFFEKIDIIKKELEKCLEEDFKSVNEKPKKKQLIDKLFDSLGEAVKKVPDQVKKSEFFQQREIFKCDVMDSFEQVCRLKKGAKMSFLKKVVENYFNLLTNSKHVGMFKLPGNNTENWDDLLKDMGLDTQFMICGTKNNENDDKRGDHKIFASKSNLKKCYDFLYNHRNRCAHNTLSYQKNLPTLEVLANEDYQKFDNYYIRFLTLILIDEIFMVLFKKYKEIMLPEMHI